MQKLLQLPKMLVAEESLRLQEQRGVPHAAPDPLAITRDYGGKIRDPPPRARISNHLRRSGGLGACQRCIGPSSSSRRVAVPGLDLLSSGVAKQTSLTNRRRLHPHPLQGVMPISCGVTRRRCGDLIESLRHLQANDRDYLHPPTYLPVSLLPETHPTIYSPEHQPQGIHLPTVTPVVLPSPPLNPVGKSARVNQTKTPHSP